MLSIIEGIEGTAKGCDILEEWGGLLEGVFFSLALEEKGLEDET